jgi:hypothetical protein
MSSLPDAPIVKTSAGKLRALSSKDKKEIVDQINRDAGIFCPPQSPADIRPNDIVKQIFRLYLHRALNVIDASTSQQISEADTLKCLLDALPITVRGELELSMNPIRTLQELPERIEHLYPWSKYVKGWGVSNLSSLRGLAAGVNSAQSSTINQFLKALKAHRTFHQVVLEVFRDRLSRVSEVEALNIAFAQDNNWNCTGVELRETYPDDVEYLEHGYLEFQKLNAQLATREHFQHQGQLGSTRTDRAPPKIRPKLTQVNRIDTSMTEYAADSDSESFVDLDEDYGTPTNVTAVRKVRLEPPAHKSPLAQSSTKQDTFAAQLTEMKQQIEQLTGVIQALGAPDTTATVNKVELQSRQSAYQKAVDHHDKINPQTDEAKAKTEALLRTMKNPDICFGYMDHGKCSNLKCARSHICRFGKLHEHPAVTDTDGYRVGCTCCSLAQFAQAERTHQYTKKIRAREIDYKQVRKPTVLTETEVGGVAEDCAPIPYPFDSELGIDLNQLRESWLKLMGKTPVATPSAPPAAHTRRISPIPNAPDLHAPSSTVRIETTVPGGKMTTRFINPKTLTLGCDLELKLDPLGPGMPHRKPPEVVRLLSPDKLNTETAIKIRAMSVKTVTPDETVTMDNAVGMACTKARIGQLKVIVSWDPGSGVSWITPSLIALLKKHEIPFYTVRVRDGRVGGWGGAQTTVHTAYYV